MKNYYVLLVWGDVEPELIGPYTDEETRDKKSKSIKEEHGDEHGIYAIESDGKVSISAYSGYFFEPEPSDEFKDPRLENDLKGEFDNTARIEMRGKVSDNLEKWELYLYDGSYLIDGYIYDNEEDYKHDIECLRKLEILPSFEQWKKESIEYAWNTHKICAPDDPEEFEQDDELREAFDKGLTPAQYIEEVIKEMDKQTISFEEYEKKVHDEAWSRFNLSPNDFLNDDDELKNAYNDNETPEEFVARIGSKYDLQDINEFL